ncbi:MAG TPA: hypothetical protein VK724_12555 [Bryobacteraceae bacterium]|jgi:hypothetical protein|nr:hypothetical protein [Bryobacteraceae bacterium]
MRNLQPSFTKLRVAPALKFFRNCSSIVDAAPVWATIISGLWVPAIVIIRVYVDRVGFYKELARTDPYEPSLLLTVTVSALVFRQLRTALDDTVSKLLARGILQPIDESVSLGDFRLAYARTFNSTWRIGLVLLSLIIAISAAEMNGMGVIPHWPLNNNSWDDLRSYVRAAWTLLLLWFLWQPLISGIFISRLTTMFAVGILPLHPDQCGGLKGLGDCCLKMALPFVVIAVMLLVWAFAPFSQRYPGMPEFSLLTLLFVLFPISLFAFLRPLWNIHVLMCEVRDEYQQRFAELLHERLTTLGDPLGAADGLLRNDKLRNEFEKLPTWPFRWKLALSLFSPQVFAVAKLLYGVLPQISITRP